MPNLSIGAMRERLTFQLNTPASKRLSSLTRTSTTGTATTTAAHGYSVGDYVTISGSAITGWNAKVKILTVPTATTFTFACSASLTTPATGTMNAVYTSNAQGGIGVEFWRQGETVYAELVPLAGQERLQMQAIQSGTLYRFRVWAMANLSTTMRALWTPTWPEGTAAKTLAITNVQPVGDGRMFYLIDTAEVAA